MKIYKYSFALLVIVLVQSEVFAQFVVPSSPRNVALGGCGESLCDDPFSRLDNIASLGRDNKENGFFGLSYNPPKFFDYSTETMETTESVFLSNMRIVIVPERNADYGKWIFYLNTVSPSMSWKGTMRDESNIIYNVEAQSTVKEFGLGFGFEIFNGFHMGIAVGATFSFSEWQATRVGTTQTVDDDGVSILPIPVVHVGIEYFILPSLNISVNALIGGFNDTDEDSFDDVRSMESYYLAGPGPMQLNFSIAYELSPFFHLTGGYILTKMNAPSWSTGSEFFEEMLHSVSFGAEYILPIGCTSVQLAIRVGGFMENLQGSTDVDEHYLLQVKKGLRGGCALKLGKMVVEAVLTAIYTNDSQFDLNKDPFYVSVGFIF